MAEHEDCPDCAGTGEGPADGTSCPTCRGCGYLLAPAASDTFDFEPPAEALE